jgi:ELWxxDGT repeat protein
MKRNGLAVALSCIATMALHAQTHRLVKDINTSANPGAMHSMPREFIRYGLRVFFSPTSISASREIWTTDGTPGGTSLFIRIGSTRDASVTPPRFTIVNGTLLFNAVDHRGDELWMTDGTVAGTRLMADIGGFVSSSPGDRIVFSGSMIFSAFEPVNGRELWITDGTPQGTRHFKDLEPGPSSSEPRSFVLMNGTVYFSAADAIWKSDGTPEGTVVVKDGVSATQLTVAGSRLFFNGYTTAAGSEPWVSDGTEAGTRQLADIVPGGDSSGGYPMTPLGDRVLFAANDRVRGTEPWISDGTAAGTKMLRDVFPGAGSAVGAWAPAVIGGTAIFSARGHGHDFEVWKTDGTEAGTMLLRDILPGSDGSSPRGFRNAGGKVFFAAWSGRSTSELWTTDGTDAGTRLVRTTGPRLAVVDFYGDTFTNIDGVVYFTGATPLHGYEPWKSDGTDAGTSMVANVAQDTAPSSTPRNLRAARDWVYFEAWDGLDFNDDPGVEPRSLWRTDGTPEGTVELLEKRVSDTTVVGGTLFFRRNNVLWTSDGTPAGTKEATELAGRFKDQPFPAFSFGDTLLVGSEGKLWATKLAPGSAVVPLDQPIGYGYVEYAGRVFYFSRAEHGGSFSVIATDGTPGGTYVVARGIGGYVQSDTPAVMGGHLYFMTGGNGTRLWKTEGTFEGTVVVKEIPGGGELLTVAGRRLFFSGGTNLWTSDGTGSGTYELPVLSTETIAAAGDRVVFRAADSTAGAELWVSDGTIGGTRLLRDIRNGTAGSQPSSMVRFGGLVYFRAADEVHGSEVWVTDGTAEGTKLVADVNPGTGGSFPQEYTLAGEQLFFSGSTPAIGSELWVVPLSHAPRLAIGDVRVDESASTTARFTVTLSAAATQTVTVEYATSDGTATSGSDYDSASGTLVFAAGETSKTIDVAVRRDSSAENNETFFVTLRNGSGAAFEKLEAFAVIEDDDHSADVAVALYFDELSSGSVYAGLSNEGPSVATSLRSLVTRTPAEAASGACATCVYFPFHLGSGDSVRGPGFRYHGGQQYLTVSASAREHDPDDANNRLGWTTSGYLSMEALHLTPGSTANIRLGAYNAGTFSIESSNPAVVSVPASVTAAAAPSVVSFAARGVAAGTATIRVFTPTETVGTLEIEVLAPGATRRWPGALYAFTTNGYTSFDDPLTLKIYTSGTAPFNGATATGHVIVKSNGRQVGEVLLASTSESRVWEVPYYATDIGDNRITVEYAGDENFLPETTAWTITSVRGHVSMTTSTVARTGTTATIRVRVEGSPMGAPTGTIHVSGSIPGAQANLVPTTAGTSEALVTLTNVPPGTHTLALGYSGDARYFGVTQDMRIMDERRRAVRH